MTKSGTCQHCLRYYPLKDGLLSYHDWPPMCRAVCRGAKLPPLSPATPEAAEDELNPERGATVESNSRLVDEGD
jgi:hypothetical protein